MHVFGVWEWKSCRHTENSKLRNVTQKSPWWLACEMVAPATPAPCYQMCKKITHLVTFNIPCWFVFHSAGIAFTHVCWLNCSHQLLTTVFRGISDICPSKYQLANWLKPSAEHQTSQYLTAWLGFTKTDQGSHSVFISVDMEMSHHFKQNFCFIYV